MQFIDDVFSAFKRHKLITLFLILFIVYNLNARVIGSGDTVPASLLPFSILENHDLYFDQFIKYYQSNGVLTYYFSEFNGHYISAYPIVTGIVVTPIYVIPYVLLKLSGIPIDLSNPIFSHVVMLLEKLSASIIASLAAIFFYLSLKEVFKENIAILGTIIFALATNTWMIGSQGLWQHGLIELYLCILLYLIFRCELKQDNRTFVYMGIVSSLLVFTRPSDSIMLLPIILYVLYNKFKGIIPFVFSMAIISLPLIIYNLYFFNNVFGGYSSLTYLINLNNISKGIPGLLVSPSRGLFIYTPVALLAIPGYFQIKSLNNKNIQKILYIFGISIICEILLYSAFNQWWAGLCYGPRFLTSMLPVLSIYITINLNRLNFLNKTEDLTYKEEIIAAIIFLLILSSIMVQLIGATALTNGGWKWDLNIDISTQAKFWDWGDTQISRCLQTGPGGFTFIERLIS